MERRWGLIKLLEIRLELFCFQRMIRKEKHTIGGKFGLEGLQRFIRRKIGGVGSQKRGVDIVERDWGAFGEAQEKAMDEATKARDDRFRARGHI